MGVVIGTLRERYVARHLIGQEHADFPQQGAKQAGARLHAAHEGQFMLHQGMSTTVTRPDIAVVLLIPLRCAPAAVSVR